MFTINQSLMRWMFIILACSVGVVFPTHASIKDCNEILFSRSSENPIDGLVAGEKVYGEIPLDFEIDRQTQLDMDLEGLATVLDPYLHTDMGRARWRYRLTHPQLNVENIRQTQEIIRYIADHTELFDEFRQHLHQLHIENEDFLKHFSGLEKDTESLKSELLWAGLTWSLLALPRLSKSIYAIGVYLHAAFSGQGNGLGYMNTIKKVIPKRIHLFPFRDQMLSAKLAHQATKDIDIEILSELRRHIGVIYEGRGANYINRKWLSLNAALNEEDKDLLPNDLELDQPLNEESLWHLHQNLRLLERKWSFKLPGGRRAVPLPNFGTLADKLHVSNFWLRKVRSDVVDRKPQLAKVFSAIAELEVLVAMADFYNAHREHMIFPQILNEDQTTQLIALQSHHYQIAVNKPDVSVSNDIRLGEVGDDGTHGFVISFSETGGGTTTYQQMAGTNQILAQNGMPWFAKEGQLTPGLLMTALDLTTSLSKGRSYNDLEASRIGQILRLSDIYPRSFTYINNPFTEGGEFAGIALREATILALMKSQTFGIMSTRSRVLLTEIRKEPGLDFVHIQNFRAKPFDLNAHKAEMRPDAYYAALVKRGIPQEVVDYAKAAYDNLRDQYSSR